mmetsp:Transcript_28189/g.61954  ORF Transcript_28189/g.61954 Transcript_28189/m.61954 type:complete len:85 (-) Transcript_28189:115-369(-)
MGAAAMAMVVASLARVRIRPGSSSGSSNGRDSGILLLLSSSSTSSSSSSYFRRFLSAKVPTGRGKLEIIHTHKMCFVFLLSPLR